MKRIPYVFLALLSALICIFASGCMRSTNPTKYTWYLQSYTISTSSLADGASISRTFEVGYGSVFNPLSATYTKKAEITLTDNQITLKRYTGETLQGAYETTKPKLQSKVLTATFNNGYVAHMIVAAGYKVYPTLHVDILDENGILETYLFTSNHQGQCSKEEIDKSTLDIALAVKDAAAGNANTIIQRGYVNENNGKYFLTAANGEVYDLSLAIKGLYPIYIHSDNTLSELTSLQEGVCYYATEHVQSQYYAIVIYYCEYFTLE